MFRSLRWRMVGAFGLVIVLTVLLGGVLSWWATTNQFNILVTDEGQQRAAEIAPLLEAGYTYRGNWGDLNDLLTSFYTESASPPDLFESPWYSDVDWWQVTLAILDLDDATLSRLWDEMGNLASVAERQGVEPEALVQAIVKAEQSVVAAAVAAGDLTPDEAVEELEWVADSAAEFVWGFTESFTWDEEGSQWDVIVADELDLSLEQLNAALDDGRSVAELAKQQDVEVEDLIDAILLDVEIELYASAEFTDGEVEWQLAQLESSLWTLIDPDAPRSFSPSDRDAGFSWTDEGTTWLVNNLLLGDERLLVTDVDGQVVYDSAGTRKGERLPASMLNKGAPLWDERGIRVGTAIVAAGPGYYDAQQTSFLQSMGWSLAVSGLVAGLAALLVGLVVTRRVTAPVTALTAAAGRLARGDQTTRLPVRSNDELGRMSAAFNTMAEALETQRTLRARLVDDIAHELNTPLSVIQLELEALKDRMQTPKEATSHVQREIDLLRNLVEDLALLTETAEETLQLNLEPTDLVQLTVDSVARWRPQAQAAGVELQMAPTEPLPLIEADALRLIQVLGNLISNALQHTPEGGQIKVKCQKEQDDGREWLSVTVSDTGVGISSQDLPHVFERFYRADRSRSRRTGGRGLGLAIVRQIVERHGGQVWVESQPGAGSTFGYRLPVC